MPTACYACSHPERAAIDAALLAGKSGRAVAAKWGGSQTSMRRHLVGHLAAGASTASASRGASAGPPPKPLTRAEPPNSHPKRQVALAEERRAHVAEIRDLRLRLEWHKGMPAELAAKWGVSLDHVGDLVRVVDIMLADMLDPQAWGTALADYARQALVRIWTQGGKKFDSLGASRMLEVVMKLTGTGSATRVDVTSAGKPLGALPAQAEAMLESLLALNPTPKELEAFSLTGELPSRSATSATVPAGEATH